MGVIISRFRKKSAPEQLENIEEEIAELEACSADSKLRHQKITKQLLIYSSGLCIIFAVLLYFYIPSKLQTKIILIMLLVLSPLIYYLVNKIISWYYKRKIASSHRRLKDLKNEKKRLIDEIMNKETYKVAKEILEKYAPETLPPKNPARHGGGTLVPVSSTPGLTKISLPGGPAAVTNTQSLASQANRANINFRAPNQTRQGPLEAGMGQKMLPFNMKKGYVERLLEYLIGDGPNNRYALICSNCSTHNGMTLQEEFEYTAFRCYVCFTLNPARKQRPVGPKLEVERFDRDTSEPDSCSSSVSGEQDLIVEADEDREKEDKLEGEFYSGNTKEEVRKFSETPDSQDTENNEFEGRASSSTQDLRESSSLQMTSEGEKDAPVGTQSEKNIDIFRASTTSDDLKNRLVKSETGLNGVVDSETEAGRE